MAKSLLSCLLALSICSLVVAAQQTSLQTQTAVPRLINFSGRAADSQGKPTPGIAGITFAIYRDESGGAPLWVETQNVQIDAKGSYSVKLGATSPEGLPLDLFASGEARWLGVRVNGGEEQPRVLLLSVPYALKAADAQTLGGLPPSAFVLATPVSGSGSDGTTAASTPPGPSIPGTMRVTTSGGTVNKLAKFDAITDVTSSILFDNGTNVGIGTTTPATTLDVAGAGTIRGALSLPSVGTATAAAGADSQPVNLSASSFNSGTASAVSQNFRWQAEPASNNTSTPSATLNLLFGQDGSAPAETGLSLSNTGLFTFAPGQTFPGTGTITGITTSGGSGLTGGGTSGNLNLSLTNACAANQVLQWSGAAWVCAATNPGTITGVTAGADLTGGGSSGNVTLNLDTTKVPQLAAANTFTQPQTVNATNPFVGAINATSAYQAITGTMTSNDFFTGAITGNASATGAGVTFGVVGTSSTDSGAGVWGGTSGASGSGVWGGVSGPNVIGVKGTNSSSGTGVYGSSFGGIGVYGTSSGGNGVQGVVSGDGLAGVYGVNNHHSGDDINDYGVQGLGGPGGDFSGTYDTLPVQNGFYPFGGDGVWGNGGDSENGFGGTGVVGTAGFGFGVNESSFGIFGQPVNGYAHGGEINGDFDVVGTLTKGGGSFKIDHPLDPANKYLYHSFVESPDMMNVYNGNVTLDGNGEAIIRLPEWFEALNRDFRYQLTSIGGFAPVYITQKVQNNAFKIAGGRAGMEVSWQVTGIRQDAWANAHRIPVEVEKPTRERGYYLHPELYGAPEEKQIGWLQMPRVMKQLKQRRAKIMAARPAADKR